MPEGRQLYRLDFTKAASRELRKLAKSIQPKQMQRIRDRVNELAKDPRPAGCEKIEATEGEIDLWRVRSGNYRIVYQIEDEALLVVVIRIGHRREIYRRR